MVTATDCFNQRRDSENNVSIGIIRKSIEVDDNVLKVICYWYYSRRFSPSSKRSKQVVFTRWMVSVCPNFWENLSVSAKILSVSLVFGSSFVIFNLLEIIEHMYVLLIVYSTEVVHMFNRLRVRGIFILRFKNFGQDLPFLLVICMVRAHSKICKKSKTNLFCKWSISAWRSRMETAPRQRIEVECMSNAQQNSCVFWHELRGWTFTIRVKNEWCSALCGACWDIG